MRITLLFLIFISPSAVGLDICSKPNPDGTVMITNECKSKNAKKLSISSDSVHYPNIYKYIDKDGIVSYGSSEPNDESIVDYEIVSLGMPKPEKIETINISTSLKNKIQEAVKDNLTDPYSMHFKMRKTARSFGNVFFHYCGLVNAKNKFGGYVGYTPFFVSLEKLKNDWRIMDVKISGGLSCTY